MWINLCNFQYYFTLLDEMSVWPIHCKCFMFWWIFSLFAIENVQNVLQYLTIQLKSAFPEHSTALHCFQSLAQFLVMCGIAHCSKQIIWCQTKTNIWRNFSFPRKRSVTVSVSLLCEKNKKQSGTPWLQWNTAIFS